MRSLSAKRKEDILFIQDIGKMEMKIVATKWAKILGWNPLNALGNCRGKLDRIRKRIVIYQDYLNKIRTLQRTNPRIRKLTTSGALPEQEEELILE